MAGHRFGGTNGNAFRAVAENSLDRARLSHITETSRSSVGINVIHLINRQLRVFEREFHCVRRSSAIVWRRRHVMRVRAQAVTDKLAINLSVALFCALQFFDDNDACSLPDDKAVAISVPRS